MENKKPQSAPAPAAKASAKPASAKSAQPIPKKTSAQPTPAKVAQPMQKKAPIQPTPIKSPEVKPAKRGLFVQFWHLAISAVVVVGLVAGAVFLGTRLVDKDVDDPIVDYTGDLSNNGTADPSDITLPGYPALTFFSNSKKVAIELPNPSGNPCYFRYTLTIVETGEEIYQSELIEPGKMLGTITLDKALTAGTYTLRITIDTFSLADGTTPMNGGVQEVKLTVK